MELGMVEAYRTKWMWNSWIMRIRDSRTFHEWMGSNDFGFLRVVKYVLSMIKMNGMFY